MNQQRLRRQVELFVLRQVRDLVGDQRKNKSMKHRAVHKPVLDLLSTSPVTFDALASHSSQK